MESFCHRWTATLLFIWLLIQPGKSGVTAYTSSGETHLRVGSTVEIKCDFFKANGLPASGVKIEMIRSKGYIENDATYIPISDNDKVRVNDTTVTVTYRKVLSRADYVTVYTCKLTINEQPDDPTSLYITVWDTPTPVITWKTHFLHIGTSESWTCTADGATDEFPSVQFLIQRPNKQKPLILMRICPTCEAETRIKYTDAYGLETYKVLLTATLSSTTFTPPKQEGDFIPLYCTSYYGPTRESLSTLNLDRKSNAIRIKAPLPPTRVDQPQRGNNAPQAPIARTIVTARHTVRHQGVGGIAFTNTNPTTTNNNNEHLTTTTSELATTTDNVEQYDDDMFEDATGDKSKKGKSSLSATHVGGIVVMVMGTVLYVIFVAVSVKWHGKYLERRLDKYRAAMVQRRRSSISIQMNVPKRGSDSATTSIVESAATNDVGSAATSDLGSNEAYSASGTPQYEDSVVGSQSEVGGDVATSEGAII